MDAILLDVRTAARRLVRSPWFTVTVVATLAIAIGASTMMFSVVNGVLLEALPFGAADRLVAVTSATERSNEASTVSAPDFLDWRSQVHRLDALAAFDQETVNLTGSSEPVRLSAALVSANWFAMLGVSVHQGRAFADGEDRPGAPPVVILSDALWRSQFSGDLAVVGRIMHLDGVAYTVIGVAPPGFTYPTRPDAWIPLVLTPDVLALRGDHYLGVVGRVAPRTTFAAAREQFVTVTDRLRAQFLTDDADWQYTLVPLREAMVKEARTGLLVLLAAVGCVLLIACANIANLFLVRLSGRTAEIGIRMALGSGRDRIVRQLLTESVLLALLGAAGGVLLADFGLHLLITIRLGDLPRLDDVSLNGRVLVFTSVVAIATGVLFGLVPGLQASNPDTVQSIKSGTRGVTTHRRAGRLRATLVVLETALAVLLLVGASLLTRSFLRLAAVDPGFRAEHVVRFSVSLPDKQYATQGKVRAFTQDIVDRLQALPGTQAASAGFGVPFGQEGLTRTIFHVAGRPLASPGKRSAAVLQMVTPRFFNTLGIPLRKGRVVTDEDRSDGHPVAVINETLARRYFPGEDPVAHRVEFGWRNDSGAVIVISAEIVGVVGDAKTSDLTAPADPVLYMAFDQLPVGRVTFIVRSTASPAQVLSAARGALAETDPTIPMYDARPFVAAIRQSVERPRLYSSVVSVFALVALALAVIGIYGVLAYSVRARRRELGIRMALGARDGQVVGLVVRQGLRLAGVGLSVGLLVAWFASRVLATLLYGISLSDPLSYGIVCCALLAAATLASWLPARGAAAIDPVIAMRGE